MAEDIKDIHVGIVFDTNIDELEKTSKELEGMKSTIEHMPNLSLANSQAIDTALTVANTAKSRLQNYDNMTFRNDEERKGYVDRTNAMLKEFKALHSLYTSGGAFDFGKQSSFVSGLSDSLKAAFDQAIPAMATVLKTKTSSLQNGLSKIKGNSAQEMADDLLEWRDKEMKAAMNSILSNRDFKAAKEASAKQGINIERELIAEVARRTLPAYRMDEYSFARHGTAVSQSIASRQYSNPAQLLPKAYAQAYADRGYTRENIKKPTYLNTAAIEEINRMARNNQSFAESIVSSGVGHRNKSGVLEIPTNISSRDIESIRAAMYGRLEKTVPGFLERFNMYDSDSDKVISRMQSGKAGQTISAMQEFEKIITPENMQQAKNSVEKAFSTVAEKSREMQMYATREYSLFTKEARKYGSDKVGSALATYKNTTLTESTMTRLLGLDKRGNYANATDKVATIDLAGIDWNNKEDVARVSDIIKNGVDINGVKMKYHSTHKSDGGAVMRLIAEEAYNDINSRYADFAQRNGLRGSVLDLFEGNEFKSRKLYAKHEDALGKLWSPGYDSGIDFSKVKVAIVDTTQDKLDAEGKQLDLSDGVSYISQKLYSSPAQIRAGLASKGTIRPVGGEGGTIRDYLIQNGLATMDDKGNYHYYQKGLDGKKFDAINADLILSESMIKNKGLFKDENGHFYSNKKNNQIYADLLNTFGMNVMRDFGEEDNKTDRLGVQAMSFMLMPEEIKKMQMEGFQQRLKELQTVTGIKKYVFADKDNNWVAREIEKDDSFINSNVAQKEIQSYISSLSSRMASGQLIDFGNIKDSGLYQGRIAQSLDLLHYGNNGVSDDVKKAARVALRANMAEEYGKMSDADLDKEIENILQLNKGYVIDYEHENDRTLGLNRAPTGFGNLVVAKNVAKEMDVINRALTAENIGDIRGIVNQDRTGIRIGAEDRHSLGTADFDGDQVKIATGKYVEIFKQTYDQYVKLMDAIGDAGNIDVHSLDAQDRLYGTLEDAVQHIKDVTEVSMGAGTGDAARRINMIDKNNPANIKFLRAGLRGQTYYDALTTGDKDPKAVNVEADKEYLALLGLGKEYTKFTEKRGSTLTFDDDMYKRDQYGKRLDELDTNNEDVYYDEQTGMYFNMRAMRNMDLNKINLPSMNMASDVAGRELTAAQYSLGGDLTEFQAMERAMEYFVNQYENSGIADMGPKAKQYMNIMNKLRSQFSYGRKIISEPETVALNKLMNEVQAEIENEATSKTIGATGLVKDENGELVEYKDYVRQRGRKAGLHVGRNALDLFGFTEKRMRAVDGNDKTNKDLKQQASKYVIQELQDIFAGINAATFEEETPAQTQPEQNTQTQGTSKSSKSKGTKKKSSSSKQKEPEQTIPDETIDNVPNNTNNGGPNGGTNNKDLLAAMAQQEAFSSLLERGKELRSAMWSPVYKNKEESFSANWFGQRRHAFEGYYNQADELLKDKTNKMLYHQEGDQAGQLTEAGRLLFADIQNIGSGFRRGNAAFAMQRSGDIMDNLRKNISGAHDVDNAFDAIQAIMKQQKDYDDLVKGFKDSNAIKIDDGTIGYKKEDKAIIEVLEKRKETVAALIEQNRSLVIDNFAKSFDKDMENIEKTLNSQQMSSFYNDIGKQYSNSLINGDVVGIFKDISNKENTRDNYKKALEDKQKQLDGYELEKNALEKDLNIKSTHYRNGKWDDTPEGQQDKAQYEADKQLKLELLNISIESTTAQVQGLTQVLKNAQGELDAISGSNAFIALGKSIDSARNSLRQMTRGLKTSSTLSQIDSVENTIGAAKAANKKLREESGFFIIKPGNKKASWDTSTAEGRAAKTEYDNNEALIKELESDRQGNYDAIFNRNVSDHNAFMRNLRNGTYNPSQWERIEQLYNGKMESGTDRINSISENIRQAKKEQVKIPLNDQRWNEYDRNIKAWQNQIDELRAANESLSKNKDTDIENAKREARFQNFSRSQQIANSDKWARQSFADRMSDMDNRALYRTSLGRELLNMRNVRQGAEQQYDRLEIERAAKTNQLQTLRSQRASEKDKTKLEINAGEIANTEQEIANLTARMEEQQAVMNKYPASADLLNSSMNLMSDAIMRLATQVFRRAIQEAKTFVQQFDAQMTEIQMVTLKSDDELSKLGDGFIKKAVTLKASIGDVTSAATALYRQGLSDEEVDSRLDDILKFSRVGGVKAADATKLITVAKNGNMVESAAEAVDVVAAISDSAATDAASITKGLQKSMYAAKSIGVTYDQLVSMLAVITSKTQLSGQVAGTTLATIFSRLQRINNNEVVYDEDGNATSASDTALALRAGGVEMYKDGKLRSGFEILSDLGANWGNLDDMTKGNIAYRLGGGRQVSNLQALLEGFSEVDENGKNLLQTLQEIASASDGIVDKKYEAYTESLQGAMTGLKSSFDQLVDSTTNSKIFSGGVNILADLLQGLTSVNEALGKIPSTIIAISTALLAVASVIKTIQGLATVQAFAPIIAMLGAAAPYLLGAAAVVGVGAIGGAIYNNYKQNQVTPEQRRKEYYDELKAKNEKGEAAYETANTLNNKRLNGQVLSETETENLVKAFEDLNSLGLMPANTSLQTLTSNADEAAKALGGVKNNIDNNKNKASQQGYSNFIASFGSEAMNRLYAEAQEQNLLTVGSPEEARALLSRGNLQSIYLRDTAEQYPLDFGFNDPNVKNPLMGMASDVMMKDMASTLYELANTGANLGSKKLTIEQGNIFGGGKKEKQITEMSVDEILTALHLKENESIFSAMFDRIKDEELSYMYSRRQTTSVSQMFADHLAENLAGVSVGKNDLGEDLYLPKEVIIPAAENYVKRYLENNDLQNKSDFEKFGDQIIKDYGVDETTGAADAVRSLRALGLTSGILTTNIEQSTEGTTKSTNPWDAVSNAWRIQYDAQNMNKGQYPEAFEGIYEAQQNLKEREPVDFFKSIIESNEDDFKKLISSGDKTITSLFDGVYNRETGVFDESKITQTLMDDFMRYIASNVPGTNGLLGTMTQQETASRNLETFDFIANKNLDAYESLKTNPSAYSQSLSLDLLKSVLSEETIAGLAGNEYNQEYVDLLRNVVNGKSLGLSASTSIGDKNLKRLNDQYIDALAESPEAFEQFKSAMPTEILSVIEESLSGLTKSKNFGILTGIIEASDQERATAAEEARAYVNGVSNPYTRRTSAAMAMRGLDILSSQDKASSEIVSEFDNWYDTLTDLQKEAIKDSGFDLEGLRTDIAKGELNEDVEKKIEEMRTKMMEIALGDSDWVNEMVSYYRGLTSNSFATQLNTSNQMIDRANQLQNFSMYTNMFSKGQTLSNDAYSSMSSVLGISTQTIKAMGKTSDGRNKIKEFADKMYEDSSKALATSLFESLSDDSKKIIDDAKTKQLTMDTEELTSLIQNEADQGLIWLFEALGVTIKNGIMSVDTEAVNGTQSIQDSIDDSSNEWKATNKYGRLNNLRGMLNLADGDPVEFRRLLDGGKLEDAGGVYDNPFYDPEIANIFKNNPQLMYATTAYQEGTLDSSAYAGYVDRAFNPGSPSALYNNAVMDYMGSNRLSNGVIDNGSWMGLSGDALYNNFMTNRETALSGENPFGATIYESLSSMGSEGTDVAQALNNVDIAKLTGDTDQLTASQERLKEAIGTLAAKIKGDYVEAMNAGSKYAKQMGEAAQDAAAGGVESAKRAGEISGKLRTLEHGREGFDNLKKNGKNTSSKDIQKVASATSKSAKDIKDVLDNGTKEEIAAMMQQIDEEIKEGGTSIEADMDAYLTQGINDGLADLQQLAKEKGVNLDLSEFFKLSDSGDWVGAIQWLQARLAEMGGELDSALVAAAQEWASKMITATIKKQESGDNTTVKVETETSGLKGYNTGSHHGGGGGGRGKNSGSDKSKSPTDRLLEKIKYGGNLFEHRKNMIQYEESLYENRDQLTMYGKALEKEIELNKGYIPILQQNIQALKQQMKAVGEGTEEWYKLRESLFSSEEKMKDLRNNTEDLTKKLKENRKAILESRQAVIDTVKEEMETRVQEQRDMLSARTDMEQTILENIKNRYQTEWDLIKKDIERKRRALEDEKSMISERLSKRKEAEDEAAKYQELAELKSQYANVSMDTSRTKDANELRKRIQDIEKEVGWNIAEQEASMQTQAISDQIDAYDSYVDNGEENMDSLLSDANNFAQEVNKVLQMNKEDLVKWLQNNDEEYANSLSNTKETMVQEWTDAYKEMYGIVDTYWKEINKIISSEQKFIQFMQNSSAYKNAGNTGKSIMNIDWLDEFEKYLNAYKNTGKGVHLHVTVEEGDYTGKEYNITKNAAGGLADYTGLTWVDGTFDKPERILSAEQTAQFDRMVDILSDLNKRGVMDVLSQMSKWSTNAFVKPTMSAVDTSSVENNLMTVGDINVTLNEAKLKEDADYYEVASRVGQVFAKELSKQGIRTNFNF